MRNVRQQTIRINHGYRIDTTWEAAALVGRGVARLARAAWRWRTELGLGLPLLAVRLLAGRIVAPDAAVVATVLVVAAVLAWPASRRLALGRLGCARTRRRLLACLRETRVATSSGRLPLVLRCRTTSAGERLTLALFPGQSAELLDARVEELRAAARAMDVTVTRSPRRADRVTVEVIRRDLLHPGVLLPSPLAPLAAALTPPRPCQTPRPSFPLPRRSGRDPLRPAPTCRRHARGPIRPAVAVRADLPSGPQTEGRRGCLVPTLTST